MRCCSVASLEVVHTTLGGVGGWGGGRSGRVGFRRFALTRRAKIDVPGLFPQGRTATNAMQMRAILCKNRKPIGYIQALRLEAPDCPGEASECQPHAHGNPSREHDFDDMDHWVLLLPIWSF